MKKFFIRPRKKGYKLATYRGVPSYFNLETNDIEGRNWVCDRLILMNLWFDRHIVGVSGIPIMIIDDEK